MYAATGDPRFKERADYLVTTEGGPGRTRRRLHRRADGHGWTRTNQQVRGKILFQELSQGNIRSGGFDLNGMWSPWYVQHKIFAGLRDAYRYTGNQTALEVEIKFAAWAESILSSSTTRRSRKCSAPSSAA